MDREKTWMMPFELGNEVKGLGEIRKIEQEGPGIYYVCVKLNLERGNEYYVVARSSPIISAEAKEYGIPLPEYPDLLTYALDTWDKTCTAVRYELYWYRLRKGIPLEEYDSLHSVAAYGREDMPEYFGAYPVPQHTPREYTLRHRQILNGIYWLETDQGERLLAVCYPIGDAELSPALKRWVELTEYDRSHGIHKTLGYYFFRERDACVVLFELWRGLESLQTSRLLSPLPLMNAIWKHHPLYAVQYNLEEGSGKHDIFGQLMHCFGTEEECEGDVTKMISFCPDVGCDFLRFEAKNG